LAGTPGLAASGHVPVFFVYIISDMYTPDATSLLGSGVEVSFTNRILGLDCFPRNLRRRVGPKRAGTFGLRA
jgi:hypothetical protein